MKTICRLLLRLSLLAIATSASAADRVALIVGNGAYQNGSVLENPARFVSQGLNACIAIARGDLIVRLDCHSRYPADYLRLCAQASEETGAWNVGGVVRANGTTVSERAVACAMDSPFGRGILVRTPMKKIAVHFDREADGRWIAEAEGFPGVLAYGATKDDAFQAAAALCLRVIIDRMEHGEAPSVPIVDELFAVA